MVQLIGTPAYDYNEDEIEEAFLVRASFTLQDTLSAFNFIIRNSATATSLTVPLHILWCSDSPTGSTFRQGLSTALKQNLGATLEFLETRSAVQLGALDSSDLEMILAASSDLSWFAKHSTFFELIARAKLAHQSKA